MIQSTRLATEHEKSVMIAYLKKSDTPQNDYGLFLWSSSNKEIIQDWNLASFVVLEIKDMEDKIVIVNQVTANSSDSLDIATNHYLLSNNNEVTDISISQW